MSYYAVPVYVGLSCVLSLSYSCMECAKSKKGNVDTATKSIMLGWIIVSGIVAAVIAGVVGEITLGISSVSHILIALILACVTLIISGSIVYWS